MSVWSYTILFAGVGVSWIGIPIVGGVALAAAGALAGDGQLNVWLVVLVATAGAWTGGYLGYLLGWRAADVLTNHPGRWHQERARALNVGKRFYRRWGPLAVFLTPTWVSGALRMPPRSFLIWNALAAIVSPVVAVFGAYAVARAALDHLSVGRGLMVAVAVATAAVVGGVVLRRRGHDPDAIDEGARNGIC